MNGTYYVTFGQQYRATPHPKDARAHPDGWFEVQAPSYESAREKAVAALSLAWCFLYEADEFNPTKHHYPRGCLATI